LHAKYESSFCGSHHGPTKILDQKSPGPPGWGLMQQASPLLTKEKKIAKKPIGKILKNYNYLNRILKYNFP